MNSRDEASLRNIDFSLDVVCSRHWKTKSCCNSCPFYIEACACCIKKHVRLLLDCVWDEDQRKESKKNA